MRARASLDTQRRRRNSHFFLSLSSRMYIYFFDVRVLCACACIYISCDERKASRLIRNLHRRKEVKISKISAFLRKYLTFSRKQKDVFLKSNSHMRFFLLTRSPTSNLSAFRQTRETPFGSSEEEEWLLHRHHLESARRRLLRERRGHVVSSTSWCM